MNGQRMNRSAAFLCRSWAEQCPVHGPKYVSGGATAAVPGTGAPKALRSGPFSITPPPLPQTHFLHRYRLHNGHVCLLETLSHGDGFAKGAAFLPRLGPTPRPPSLPAAVTSRTQFACPTDFCQSAQVPRRSASPGALPTAIAWGTGRRPPLRVPASSGALGTEPRPNDLHLLRPPLIQPVPSSLSRFSEKLTNGCFVRTALCFPPTPPSGLVRPPNITSTSIQH